MELVDMDCLHDEPNCGSCASCLARIAARKSEPEYQAHLKWARDVAHHVVIPPASDGDEKHG
jgi:hypothetical protein